MAVNPETGESDLAKAAPETARRAFAAWDVAVVRNASAAPFLGSATAGSGRHEVTAVLLLALIAALLAEGFLANRVYRVQTDAEETAGESAYSASESAEPPPSVGGPGDNLLTRAVPSGHSGGGHGAG